MIKEEINDIVEKYLFKPNNTETIDNIRREIKNYLDDKFNEGIIESYGKIEVRMKDKDTIFININPDITFKTRKIKYIYTGEDIEKIVKLIHGKIYDIDCDILTLEPKYLKLGTNILPPRQSGQLGIELFQNMFDKGFFVELSTFRDIKINELLKD